MKREYTMLRLLAMSASIILCINLSGCESSFESTARGCFSTIECPALNGMVEQCCTSSSNGKSRCVYKLPDGRSYACNSDQNAIDAQMMGIASELSAECQASGEAIIRACGLDMPSQNDGQMMSAGSAGG